MRFLLLAFFFLTIPTLAQELALDPPLTKQEQQALRDMRKQWKQSGMPAMTSEQETVLIQNMRDMQVQTMGRAMGLRAAVEAGAFSTPPQPEPPPLSAHPVPEAAAPIQAFSKEPGEGRRAIDLLARMEEQSNPPRFTLFERIRDGFKANGKPYFDVDGAIANFGADMSTGHVTYLIDTSNGEALVKHHNINSQHPAFVVGTLRINDERAMFQGADGTTAAGSGVIPTADGLLFTREGSMVRYQIGRPPVAFQVPEEWIIAEYQNGDVSGTRFVLLERANKSVNSLKSAGDAVGRMFGKRDESEDYAFFDIQNGSLIALNMNMDYKKVGQGTGCKRQNALVNKCSGWEQWTSIWKPDGSPNTYHYCWALTWQQTRFGPIAVAMENGGREVNIIQLASGERTNAFHRALGIHEFYASPTAAGSIKIRAQVGLKRQTIEDIAELLETTQQIDTSASGEG